MKLGIVTDTTSDLPRYLVDQYGIEVAPSILVIAGQEQADDAGPTRAQFYRLLPEFKSPPTTAAPSIEEFTSRYERLFNQGCEHVLSIHAARSLSAMLGTAEQAARQFEGRITVVDSRSLSLGVGFQVLAAAEAAGEGLAAAVSALESTRRRIQVFAALDTLEYARRSGRLPGAMSMLGGLLRVKPLIELTDGEIRTISIARTTKQAGDRMVDFFKAAGPLERLAILHSGAEGRAREFLDHLMRNFSPLIPRDILMLNVTPVIGAHVGPRALGFAAVRAA